MHKHRPKIEQRVLLQCVRAIMLLALALVQTSLAPTIWRFEIDWVLIAVVSWTLLRGLWPGVRWAIYGGLALDVLGSLPIGSHLLALLLCVTTIAIATEPLDREQPLLIVVCLMGAALLYGSVLLVIELLAGAVLPLPQYALVQVLPAALLNTVIAIPTFALFRWFNMRGKVVVEA